MADHYLTTKDIWINDDDGNEIGAGTGVFDDQDDSLVFIALNWNEAIKWVGDNWRDYADPDVLAEADYGLT
jgi:hypothetical protein